jgi:hypothetical protein
MLEQFNISRDLNPGYFWDVDIRWLDVKKSKRLIIERVFVMGTAKEIMRVINFYGPEEVSNVLKNLNYIDSKTLNFVSKLFGISLQYFKCYTRKQLNLQHWGS